MGTRLPEMEAELFDLVRSIKDPEHPQTLEELAVVYPSGVQVFPLDELPVDTSTHGRKYAVSVKFTPTVPHCSLATLIGLCIRVKLEEAYPGQLKLAVVVREGTHDTAAQISKQLNDKERVAAALENPNMRKLVDECVLYS